MNSAQCPGRSLKQWVAPASFQREIVVTGKRFEKGRKVLEICEQREDVPRKHKIEIQKQSQRRKGSPLIALTVRFQVRSEEGVQARETPSCPDRMCVHFQLECLKHFYLPECSINQYICLNG